MSNLMDEYFDIVNKIVEEVGYFSGELEDNRSSFWYINCGEVRFAKTEEELESQYGDYYCEELYGNDSTKRLGNNTLITVSDACGHGEYTMVFDNNKYRIPKG